MNKREIKRAEKLLKPHAWTQLAISAATGGQVITAHWYNGGQRIFWDLDSVLGFLLENVGENN
jgi:hypothetical protein